MKIGTVVKELEMDMMTESQNQRDKRVEELWKKLDPQGKKELDLKGLQKGLKRIDHPMKNADDMMKEIIQMVDTNRDGKIQYEEFRTFVEAAERQLLLLFRSIDRDHDGRVGRDELAAAFQKSGLVVPRRRLSGFFDEIDMNHDGYISFDEWRDFLLFMPTNHASPLEAALSFYNSVVMLNAEGDSMVTEETLEGLGTTGFLLQALFGSILRLAQPIPPEQSPYLNPPPPSELPQGSGPGPGPGPGPTATTTPPASHPNSTTRRQQTTASPQVRPSTVNDAPRDGRIAAAAYASYPHSSMNQQGDGGAGAQVSSPGGTLNKNDSRGVEFLNSHNHDPDPQLHLGEMDVEEDELEAEVSKTRLTRYLPEPGYFVSGAVAGGVSRTATAPLDRTKVALLASTTRGQGIASIVSELYKAGGIRTFFAGNGLNVIKIMPETAIKFGSYEAAKRTLANLEGHGDPTKINPYSKFAAGGFAGMAAQASVYPLDTLKFRLQCETVKGGLTGNALLVQTACKMVAEGGIRSAYRGMTMGLIGMFPYSAIDMATFEFLKKTYTRNKARYYGIHEEDALPGNMVTGIIGATSGALGATAVYPINVMRTRLQTMGTRMHPPMYTGIRDVATRTWRNEGIRGMYKGLTPNLLKVAPALSITWVTYENSKKIMGLH